VSPTYTVSRTASPSPTISPTFTVSPLATPVSLELDVLDSNLNVVARLTLVGGQGAVSGLSLNHDTFVPEVDRQLIVSGGQGAQAIWNGAGLDNQTLLPNGYYHMHLTQSGLLAIDVPFVIEHGQYAGGTILPEANPVPAGQALVLDYAYPEAVNLQARIYNIAGELVSQGAGAGTVGSLHLALKSAGGMDVSSGIYLVQVRGHTVNGGLEFQKMIKVAVVR
jgi:hypothetical protein